MGVETAPVNGEDALWCFGGVAMIMSIARQVRTATNANGGSDELLARVEAAGGGYGIEDK